MTHLEAAERKAAIYKAFLDFMHNHHGEKNLRKRFYAMARGRWPSWTLDTIRRAVYAKGEMRAITRHAQFRKPVMPWDSTFNLYIDHEDGRGYYGERARSYLDKLVVERIDVDFDVWDCIGENGICVEKVRRATKERMKKNLDKGHRVA